MSDLKFQCPGCKEMLEVDRSAAGQRIKCPSCTKTIVVPLAADASGDDEGGLLGFLETVFRKMIWGVFRFMFIDSPQKMWRLIFQTAPWMVRFVRVGFFALAWVLLSFWPFLFLAYVRGMEYRWLDPVKEFVVTYWRLLHAIGYVWVTLCLAGSAWGIAKWVSSRQLHKAKD